MIDANGCSPESKRKRVELSLPAQQRQSSQELDARCRGEPVYEFGMLLEQTPGFLKQTLLVSGVEKGLWDRTAWCAVYQEAHDDLLERIRNAENFNLDNLAKRFSTNYCEDLKGNGRTQGVNLEKWQRRVEAENGLTNVYLSRLTARLCHFSAIWFFFEGIINKYYDNLAEAVLRDDNDTEFARRSMRILRSLEKKNEIAGHAELATVITSHRQRLAKIASNEFLQIVGYFSHARSDATRLRPALVAIMDGDLETTAERLAYFCHNERVRPLVRHVALNYFKVLYREYQEAGEVTPDVARKVITCDS